VVDPFGTFIFDDFNHLAFEQIKVVDNFIQPTAKSPQDDSQKSIIKTLTLWSYPKIKPSFQTHKRANKQRFATLFYNRTRILK